jgi:phosphoglycolate phosphatase-like HAD superfamily hydrolase
LKKAIFFDMDGTIADLYAVENWLNMLRAYDPTPYAQAEPMLNMSAFARLLHKAQRLGYKICIISWLSKEPTAEYDMAVTQAKLQWLENHLPSVEWDKIFILPHGTPKNNFGNGFLFDDEEQNRNDWNGVALEPYEILDFLRNL